MSLSSTCIKRPVFATVMNIIMMLVGCIGLVFLGVRDYPSVDPPIISVSTSFPGANADVIETQSTARAFGVGYQRNPGDSFVDQPE